MKINQLILYILLVLLFFASINAHSKSSLKNESFETGETTKQDIFTTDAFTTDTFTTDTRMKNALRAHIEFLADDSLRGRETGTADYEIAAQYVASQFKQFGLKPGGKKQSWLQSVPFTQSTAVESSLMMVLHHADKQTHFKFPQEFVALPSAVSNEDSVRGELVFVGYGIASKELKHDDYETLDVKGKIVVMLAGRPASFPSEEGAHVSDIRSKFFQAESRGAIGVIMLHTPQAERVKPYQQVVNFVRSPLLNWQTKEGDIFDAYSSLKGQVYATMSTGKVLFSAVGLDLKQVFLDIDLGKVPTGFEMGIEVSLKRKSTHKTIESSNVIGVIEGLDPVLKNEYVVYSAHLDHLGSDTQGSDTQGSQEQYRQEEDRQVHDSQAQDREAQDEHTKVKDNIHNGALDNASGIAIMLETARSFALGKKTKRSIMFIAVTAEEKGLLGSNYFVHHSTVPKSTIVANINLDMPLILYPFADIVAFGAQHSTMQQYVESAAKANELMLIPDPMPEQALFVRSDHYSFVKQGIPSIFLAPGITSKDPKINAGQLFGMFFSQHYHQPSDDISLPINYDAGLSFTKVNFSIGQGIANSDERPRWNEGDYFGELFAKKQSTFNTSLVSEKQLTVKRLD